MAIRVIATVASQVAELPCGKHRRADRGMLVSCVASSLHKLLSFRPSPPQLADEGREPESIYFQANGFPLEPAPECLNSSRPCSAQVIALSERTGRDKRDRCPYEDCPQPSHRIIPAFSTAHE